MPNLPPPPAGIPAPIIAYLRSAGWADAHIARLTPAVALELIARVKAGEVVTPEKVLPTSEPNETWRDHARRTGERAASQAMDHFREAVASAPPLAPEMLRAQFLVEDDDAVADYTKTVSYAFLGAESLRFLAILAELHGGWPLDEVMAETADAAKSLATQLGVTPHWALVRARSLEAILTGDELGFGGVATHGLPWDREGSLGGLSVAEKQTVWVNRVTQDALMRYLDAARAAVDLSQRCYTHLRSVGILHPCLPILTPGDMDSASCWQRWGGTPPAKRQQAVQLAGELVETAVGQLRSLQIEGPILSRRKTWQDTDVVYTMGHPFTLGDSCMGTIITGATGSGKSTGPIVRIVRGLLESGAGLLFLCAKSDAAAEYVEWIKAAGREHDLVHISEKTLNRWHFNFLDWEMRRPGGGQPENVLKLFFEMIELTGGQASGSGNESYFVDQAKMLVRTSIDTVMLAGEHLSLRTLRRFVAALPAVSERPLTLEERAEAELSLVGKLLASARKNAGGNPAKLEAVEALTEYCFQQWPAKSARTRSDIVSQVEPILALFAARPLLNQGLGGTTTVSPNDILAGKLVILDFSPDAYGELALYFAAIWKLTTQWAIMARDNTRRPIPGLPGDDRRPAGIIADEAQFFFRQKDAEWHERCRSYRGIGVYSTQNIESFNEKVGGSENDQRVQKMLGNLRTKVWASNESPATNKWASDMVGEEIVRMRSVSSSVSYSQPGSLLLSAMTGGTQGVLGALNVNVSKQTSDSWSEQRLASLQPKDISELKTGGHRNDGIVEAYVYFQGIGEGGKRFFKVAFAQPWREAKVLDAVADQVALATPVTDWREVEIHTGKWRHRCLGEIPPGSLRWLQEQWQPRPVSGLVRPADARLRLALDMSMGRGAPQLTGPSGKAEGAPPKRRGFFGALFSAT